MEDQDSDFLIIDDFGLKTEIRFMGKTIIERIYLWKAEDWKVLLFLT